MRDGDEPVGVVHVRDSLAGRGVAGELMRPVLTVAATTPVYEVLQLMRETRNHLVVVDTAAGRTVVTLTDVLHRLLPAQPM